MKIILATTNKGKLAELSKMLEKSGITVAGLEDFPQIGEIVEDGASFEENALIKARTVAKMTGLPCIADDSGLVVAALDGAPGIFSARYGDDWETLGNETRDERNIRKLMSVMKDVKQRDCYFKTAIAAVKPDGQYILATGEWAGELLEEPRGVNGFGYDPVFYDPEIKKAAAELTREEKNAQSHRGKALRALLAQLPAFLADATHPQS